MKQYIKEHMTKDSLSPNGSDSGMVTAQVKRKEMTDGFVRWRNI